MAEPMPDTAASGGRPFLVPPPRGPRPLARSLAAAILGPGAAILLAPQSAPLAFAAGAGLALACLLVPGRPSPTGVAGANADAAPGGAQPDRTAFDAAGVLEAVSEPAVLMDRRLQLLHANDAATRAFGALALGDAISLRFRSPEFLSTLEAAAEVGSAAKATVEERGAGRVWAVDVSPLPGGADGRPSFFLLLFRDRTAERRIERMRTDFVANASHELRTPLASLIGFIETLQGPARDDRAARDRFLAIMREQAARMSRLIDDLLSLSQIEMKRAPRPGRTVDLAELVAEVARTMAPVLAESGMTAELDVVPGRYVVDGERDEILQVFTNLVENACKYASSGGRIVLSLKADDREAERIRLAVQDFGPGIAPEHVPRLTERFYRVNVESSRTKRGTGLGLSIVRNILQRHSARLVVESEVGKGSTFAALFRSSRERS